MFLGTLILVSLFTLQSMILDRAEYCTVLIDYSSEREIEGLWRLKLQRIENEVTVNDSLHQ